MRYRKIMPRIWRDEKFRQLQPDDKLLALYVLTAQSNRIGLFYFSIGMAAEDLGSSTQTIEERLANVCKTFGWGYDPPSKTVWIPSWWTYNPPENQNVMRGCLQDLRDVPDTPFRQSFATNHCGLHGKALETFQQTFRERLANHPDITEYMFPIPQNIRLANHPETFGKPSGSNEIYVSDTTEYTFPIPQNIRLAFQEQEQEQEQEQKNGFCAETETDPSPAPVAIERSLLEFQCDGKQPTWHLTAEQVAEWSSLFPSLDVLAECRSALAWVSANPSRRKTTNGMKRFLVAWLGRAQNRGGTGHHRDQTGQRDRGAYTHPDDMYRDAKW
ncbi:MAG: hypothetical protein MOGMAGMI_02368 [Candidatus Omnitrophica bacterium]|nr:hypothetical protein [Candidatus Omnitrophota bacterium]